MKIIVAGASGAIGRELVPALRADGCDVRRLVRRAAAAGDEIAWDPAAAQLDPRELDGVTGVINLAGENIAAGRWTAARRERILRSRADTTRTLVIAMREATRRPAVLLNASAVGVYGDRGDEVLTERSAMGRGFLPEVCLAWETHAEGATRLGVRTAFMRFGVVLTRQGGALARMRPLFRLGLGGRLGSGRQWMSWIHVDDLIGAVRHALRDTRCTGAMNFTAPEPVTNSAFTAALGPALHRPAVVPAPAWALRLAFGAMADEALLASTRAVPERLHQAGYTFHHPEITGALRSLV